MPACYSLTYSNPEGPRYGRPDDVGRQARNSHPPSGVVPTMKGVHPIAKHPRPWRRLFALIILAAMLLPYSGPGICTVLGRMGMDVHEIGMMADAGGPVLKSASSSMECCSMDGCGVPHAGPAASSVEITPGFQRRMVASVIEPSDPPLQYLSLLERPPRA